MTTIIGLSGSLRRASYNAALLRAAAELAPAGYTIEIASIRDIPLYDGDLEAEQGIPKPVAALLDQDHPGSLCLHARRHGTTEIAGRASDDHYLVLQTGHARSLPSNKEFTFC